MPVPVPVSSQRPVHQVIKPPNNAGRATIRPSFESPRTRSAFQYVIHTLPRRPTGPPAGFGTREEWLNSLPSWRRNKPRQISDEKEDGYVGTPTQSLEVRELNFPRRSIDASGSKRRPGEAHLSPTVARHNIAAIMGACRAGPDASNNYSAWSGGDCDVDMDTRYENCPNDRQGVDCSWTSDTDTQEVVDLHSGFKDSQYWFGTRCDVDVNGQNPGHHQKCGQTYAKGAFSPIHEDDSPSTPDSLEALASTTTVDLQEESSTPFAEYVDRAVTNAGDHITVNFASAPMPNNSHRDVVATRSPQPTAAEPTVTPASIRAYRRMADPLSEWIAEYVWKVCTTGMSLPPRFVGVGNNKQYSARPPSYLSRAVQSLLYATLLQPSGVVLALWYIARLPVCFEWQTAGPELQDKEIDFRMELLGEGRYGQHVSTEERNDLESRAPFRLVLLGCMLANKWLDDHTFSNKTWHTISEIPIQSVNRLEFLALALLTHDLSVPPRAWDQWLSHLRSYHTSLSPYPRPIERPSLTDSNVVVRKMIEDLIMLPMASSPLHSAGDSALMKVHPTPIFVGLAERIKEKVMERQQAEEVDPLEINLDEDGPLRDEYLPRRRSSGDRPGDFIRKQQQDPIVDFIAMESRVERPSREQDLQEALPPPAKWSPQADPPIERERDRSRGRYVAVQPSFELAHVAASHTSPASLHTSSEYVEPHGSSFIMSEWPDIPNYAACPLVVSNDTYVTKPASFRQPFTAQPHYNECFPVAHCPSMHHTRSHSLISPAGAAYSRNHSRSYSQSRFDCDNMAVSHGRNEALSQPWYSHIPLRHPVIHPPPLDDHAYFRPTWLRT